MTIYRSIFVRLIAIHKTLTEKEVTTLTLHVNQRNMEWKTHYKTRRDRIRQEYICGATKLKDAASSEMNSKYNWEVSNSNGPQKMD